MRQSKEAKQEEKISKLQQELKKSKDKIKSLESKLSTSERKRKLLMQDKESDKKKANTQSYLYSLLNDINTLHL